MIIYLWKRRIQGTRRPGVRFSRRASLYLSTASIHIYYLPYGVVKRTHTYAHLHTHTHTHTRQCVLAGFRVNADAVAEDQRKIHPWDRDRVQVHAYTRGNAESEGASGPGEGRDGGLRRG